MDIYGTSRMVVLDLGINRPTYSSDRMFYILEELFTGSVYRAWISTEDSSLSLTNGWF